MVANSYAVVAIVTASLVKMDNYQRKALVALTVCLRFKKAREYSVLFITLSFLLCDTGRTWTSTVRHPRLSTIPAFRLFH